MDKQEFINRVYSEYSSLLAISEEDISRMISRGFLVCDKEYLQFYITHFDAFRKKFEKYQETKKLLTAHELSEQLLNKLSITISEGELNKMAALGLLKRGDDFREITIEADIIQTRKES